MATKKTNAKPTTSISALLIAATLALAPGAMGQTTIHVRADAPDGGDGLSWATALNNVDDAVAAAVANKPCDVWFTSGTYTNPASANVMDLGTRWVTNDVTGVGFYGGFTGAAEDWSDRDPAKNETIVLALAAGGRSFRTGNVTDCVVDGFVFEGGTGANGGVAYMRGGGAGLVVANCVFRDSGVAGGSGGALYIRDLVGATQFNNCVFTNNLAGGGGAIYPRGTNNCAFTSCVIANNTASNGGGAIVNNNMTFVDCVISGNVAEDKGGGFDMSGATVLRGCVFSGNRVRTSQTSAPYNEVKGGALNIFAGTHTITDCAFYDNHCVHDAGAYNARGGAIMMDYTCVVDIADSVFCNNSVFSYPALGNSNARGGAFYVEGAEPDVSFSRCVISGNLGAFGGAGYLDANGATRFVNCLVTGNCNTSAGPSQRGAFAHLQDADALVVNCSFYDNASPSGVISTVLGAPVVANSVFAGNTGGAALTEVNDTGGAISTNNLFHNNAGGDFLDDGATTYAGGQAIDLNVAGASGNTDGDPLFRMGDSGAWTAAPVFEAATSRTTLTDAGASWAPMSLVGEIVKPGASPPDTAARHAYITSNTATRIEVVGDVSGWVTAADSYQILDLHLAYPSAAIDQGVDTLSGVDDPPATDFDGTARADVSGVSPAGPPAPVDIGAYEFDAPVMDVTPEALEFGTAIIGAPAQSSTKTVTIVNFGSRDAAFEGAGILLAGANADDFVIVNSPSTATLAPGASVSVDIVYAPNSPGDNNATLDVTPASGVATPHGKTAPLHVPLHGASEANASPGFTSDPIVKATGRPEVDYLLFAQTLADDATDANPDDVLTFSKTGFNGGPGADWLQVAADGSLSGTPTPADVGASSWTVQVRDLAGTSDTATLEIDVALRQSNPASTIELWRGY